MNTDGSQIVKWAGITISIVIAVFSYFGWLYVRFENIEQRLALKADKQDAADRWTGSEQREFMRYVDYRFMSIERLCSETTEKATSKETKK